MAPVLLRIMLRKIPDPERRFQLEYELELYKTISKLGVELEVLWLPREDSPISGEVKGNVIYVYESDEEEALNVPAHEFVEHLVTLGIDPIRLLLNSLENLMNRKAYPDKEKTVEALRALLKNGSHSESLDPV